METGEIGLFILNTPLYKKHGISTLGGNILDVLFFNGALDCFCPKCAMHSIFLGGNDDSERLQRKNTMSLGFDAPGPARKTRDYTGLYLLDFHCSRNKAHQLNFVFKVDDQKLMKIGQSPSALEIMQGDFKQYKALLGEVFNDLHSSIILYSNNFGVAAFTHLRRIMENFFIENAFKDWARHNPNLLKSDYTDLRFKEKINIVKDYLPESFTENFTLYSIVSSGIHGLTNAECLSYFEPLKDCIILCLEEMLNEQKKQVMKENVKKSLGKISSAIKRK